VLGQNFLELSIYAYTGVGLGIIHAALPMEYLNTLICVIQEPEPNDEFYEDI
jgi:hypothetical protein